MKRVFFDIVLILLVFLAPWWFTVLFSVLGLFLFKNFFEFLASSIIIQILSTANNLQLTQKTFFIYSAIIIFYIGIQYLRNNIILYKNEIPYKS